MELNNRLNKFLALETKKQLDSWGELHSIANDFLQLDSPDLNLAKEIASTILYHRSLMGSSKSYESATNIDIDLCEISLKIALKAYGISPPLLEFLKAALYYSTFRPERFDKGEIENLISKINLIN